MHFVENNNFVDAYLRTYVCRVANHIHTYLTPACRPVAGKFYFGQVKYAVWLIDANARKFMHV